MQIISKKFFILSAFLVIGIPLAFIAHHLYAQQSSQGIFDLTVSPVFYDYTAKPGTTLSDRIRVRNNTSSDMNLTVQLKRLGADPNLGELTLLEPGNDPAQYWFKFKNTSFTAKAREWSDVPFTITVPDNAAFGYYWAVTISQNSGNGIKGKSGAALTGASAIPVLLVVKNGEAKIKADLVNFKTNKQVYEYPPVYFDVTLKDVGNVHVRPHGNIFVRAGGDNNLAILDVNQGQAALIPGVKKTFEANWNDGFVTGEPIQENGTVKLGSDARPLTKLKINWDQLTHLRIGKYTADLLLVYDNGTRDETIEATTTFWILPYKVVGGALIGLIILIILIRFLLKWYIDKEIKKRRR